MVINRRLLFGQLIKSAERRVPILDQDTGIDFAGNTLKNWNRTKSNRRLEEANRRSAKC